MPGCNESTEAAPGRKRICSTGFRDGPGSYHLAYIEEDNKSAPAIGYRFQQFPYNGRHCYIDGLATVPDKTSGGYASKLIDYVVEVFKRKGLKMIILDSGFYMIGAHRLYLQKRFETGALHFLKKI